MKIITSLTIAIGLAASLHLAQAQPGGRGGSGGSPGGGRPPMSPVMTALDANNSGVIEAGEIANASTALKTLDKNGDGKLGSAELQPQTPAGGSGRQFTPPNGGTPPSLPVMTALDANNDGELSANEIANASAALMTLDANGDDQLSRDEAMPAPPGGSGGNGRPPRQ